MGTAPTTAGPPATIVLEAESGTGGSVMPRSQANGMHTVLLHVGESLTLHSSFVARAAYHLAVRYSNDGPGTVLEHVVLSLDATEVGSFTAANTRLAGMDPGTGWNEFATSPPLGPLTLTPADHVFVVTVATGDTYGVEIDSVTFMLG